MADVQVSSPEYLKTALAQNAYGRNVTEKTSEMAQNNNAILAINGDYYGVQESGYVIRNGVIYRDTASAGQEDLVIYQDGSLDIVQEDAVTAQELLDNGAQQVLSFGPALLENSTISVSQSEEVGKATAEPARVPDCLYTKWRNLCRASAPKRRTIWTAAARLRCILTEKSSTIRPQTAIRFRRGA